MATDLRALSIRLVLIVSLIVLWAMMNAERSYACSCGELGSPSEELAEADAVFMGRVVSVRQVESSQGVFITEFLVTTLWKGPLYSTMYITTSNEPCGTGFSEGKEYIVYAYGIGRDALRTNLCTRTTPLSRGMDDLARLGEGTATPQATNTPTPQPTSTSTPQTTTTPLPELSKTGRGCGASPQTIDLSFAGLLAGLAWFGLRKPRFRRRRDD